MSSHRTGPVDLVTPEKTRRHYELSGSWTDVTLSDRVAEHARTRGDHTAIVDLEGRRTTTYSELDRDAARIAGHLASLGVGPGDVVAVQLPNWYESVAIAVGILRAGAVLNPMVTIYRQRELRHMLDAADARMLFTPGEYRGFDHKQMGSALVDDRPALRHVVVADPTGEPAAFRAWLDSLTGAGDRDLDRAPASAVSELLFSSGTEAAPKAILHTEQTTNCAARACADSLGLTDTDVLWMPSPIGHSTGFNYGVRIALYHGLPLVLQDRWDPAVAAELVLSHGATYTVAATTFLSDVVNHCRRTGVKLPSLRLFGSGGAPVPPELVDAAGEYGMTVLRLYGSTEVLVATWNRPDSPAGARRDTDGCPLDGVEIEVRDDGGRSVIGEPGEILIRGPACSVGFLDDPDRAAATYDSHGWVHSGDLGILDARGHLTIVGRKKEIIIRGGMNIAPREVEELISALPGVTRVAVVGLPDDRLGEVACACVVLDGDHDLDLPGLTAQLKAAGLAGYKLPERLAVFTELPTTPSGKIQKHRILDLLAADSATRFESR